MSEEVLRTRYLEELHRYRDIDLIKVITGMRRVGKSVLLRQFRSALEAEGIPKENIIYIDMDSFGNYRYKDGTITYEEIKDRADQGRLYILIDEVQKITDWMLMVESLRNDIDCDIYITGSNAYMLSSDIATLLTGRSITITVLPLSLKEVCDLYDEPDPRMLFLKYLRHGGLPIIRPELSEEVSFQLINELKSDIILKDICSRRPGTDPIKIRNVIDYLYSEVGNPISVTRMSEALGISSSTASEYLQLITDSMLFTKVERYDLKGRMILKQEPKYYCSDTGMRYSQPMSKDRDFGKTLETMVYHELVRRGHRVYIGRPPSGNKMDDRHLEIDFIVMKDGSTDYYQVTDSLHNPTVHDREFRPLRKISGRGERYVITYDDVPVSKGPDAIVMNIVDFLMMDEPEEVPERTESNMYGMLNDMLLGYVDICSRISDTIVTRENFDGLSGELQENFFNLQAFFRRPDLIEDMFLQDQLSRIRKSNVRIFNAMVGCVNANKEPLYRPVMRPELEEIRVISDMIQQYTDEKMGV